MTVFGLGDLAFVGAVTGGYTPTDAAAAAYIAAVESADGQPLEAAVSRAIDEFVIGCKADGIWNAIKASCILAGARTLNGALVPLVGTAPTPFGFGSGDYDRKTGLIGNASSKYLNTNRAANVDAESDAHVSAYVSTVHPSGTSGAIIGSGTDSSGNDETIIESVNSTSPNSYAFRFRNDGTLNSTGITQQNGFVGISRSASASYIARLSGSNTTITQTAQGRSAFNYTLFAVNRGGTITGYSGPRIAFYSIGSSITLATLDSRVTTLINAIAAAIP